MLCFAEFYPSRPVFCQGNTAGPEVSGTSVFVRNFSKRLQAQDLMFFFQCYGDIKGGLQGVQVIIILCSRLHPLLHILLFHLKG